MQLSLALTARTIPSFSAYAALRGLVNLDTSVSSGYTSKDNGRLCLVARLPNSNNVSPVGTRSRSQFDRKMKFHKRIDGPAIGMLRSEALRIMTRARGGSVSEYEQTISSNVQETVTHTREDPPSTTTTRCSTLSDHNRSEVAGGGQNRMTRSRITQLTICIHLMVRHVDCITLNSSVSHTSLLPYSSTHQLALPI